MHIIPENTHHHNDIEVLLDQTFGRRRRDKTSYRLREGIEPIHALCFVALEAEKVMGTVRFWPIHIPSKIPALLLGPVAVLPERQGTGIGTHLITHSLKHAKSFGYKAIFLVGDEPYYRHFGFTNRHTKKLTLPGPVDRKRFLGMELTPNALREISGKIVTWQDSIALKF